MDVPEVSDENQIKANIIRKHLRHDIATIRAMLKDFKNPEASSPPTQRPLWIGGFGGEPELETINGEAASRISC